MNQEQETIEPLTEDDGIEWLGLNDRLCNILERADKRTIGDLTKLCACGILDIRNVGWNYMCVIIDQLHEHGFKLSNCRRVNEPSD